ncbi:hypothetical protein ACLK19_15180 [Escherichia coli]
MAKLARRQSPRTICNGEQYDRLNRTTAWQTRGSLLDDPVIGELRNRYQPGLPYCSGDSPRGSRSVDQA